MQSLFEIRKATKKDIPIIFKFIKQLAEQGKLSDELVSTEEILTDSLFGQKVYAEVIIGYLNNKSVSYALFTHNFSTLFGRPGLYLVDLFVVPEARNLGIGRNMLLYLAKLAKERQCCRFEWSVLHWNDSAIRFYENLGAKEMSEWKIFRVSGEALDKLASEKFLVKKGS